MSDWYRITNIETLDSPALVVYPDRVAENIHILKSLVPDVNRLRPHMKTSKSSEVARMLMAEGINKFKCATIAEAEMLARVNAADVLLAYQPVGPKANRLASLVREFPQTRFSCLIDNEKTARHIADVFSHAGLSIAVYLDLNVGMNRTGVRPDDALALYLACQKMGGIDVIGLHAYDGHLRDPDFAMRTEKCNAAFNAVEKLADAILHATGSKPQIIAGGTPTFPIHAKRADVDCSPGTFIYWDLGYQSILVEQPFIFAALVITRVISLPDDETVCLDLGHKAIASENPLTNRVSFLNAPDLTPMGHSEEHLVMRAAKGHHYSVGDVLYGVPYHICPTVALHNNPHVVHDGAVTETWTTAARNRKISL